MLERAARLLAECPDCGLVQRLPWLPEGARALCGRCGSTLHRRWRRLVPLVVMMGVAGLGFLVVALAFPIATVFMQGGRAVQGSLLTGAEEFWRFGVEPLAVVVVLTLLGFPALKLVATSGMACGVALGRVPRWARGLFATAQAISAWAMVEVFLLGAAVALLRLEAWMEVELGPALPALVGLGLCTFAIDRLIGPQTFWPRLPLDAAPRPALSSSRLRSCETCRVVLPVSDGTECPRCAGRIHARKPGGLRRSAALASAAIFLAIPANILPVMTITSMGEGVPSTIMGGTVELVEHGYLSLAVLVFVASILVPLLKIAVLVILLVTTHRGAKSRLMLRTRLYRIVAGLGRWSMLDIYATMMLVALARFGWIGNITPGHGATAFCAVVVLTMLASESFDPRLMWDAAGCNENPS